MDEAWAIEELNRFVNLELQYTQQTGFPEAVKHQLIELQAVTELILNEVCPGWGAAPRPFSVRSSFEPIAEQARRARTLLERRAELNRHFGPTGPQLDASSLHPIVWGAAAALWDDGYLRQAVQTACVAVEAFIQGKASVTTSGADLASLFSVGKPSRRSPRLRFVDVEERSAAYTSEHEGAASMVRGAMMSVRNAVSHPRSTRAQREDESLEQLAVLSYVCRLVDRSVVVDGGSSVDGEGD